MRTYSRPETLSTISSFAERIALVLDAAARSVVPARVAISRLSPVVVTPATFRRSPKRRGQVSE